MRYVLIRDDDTNALTPAESLEQLYRPFLDRGLPVNLAIIPEVATHVTTPSGKREGYLMAANEKHPGCLPIAENAKLIRYLAANPAYHVAQHGCHHDYFEFDTSCGSEIKRRLERGTRLLQEAGFPKPETFVAPYDRMSRSSLRFIVRQFDIVSTGWFELGRIPWTLLPSYALKKLRRQQHWRAGRTLLLSHPGCLLSCHRDYARILENIAKAIRERTVTVLVTHWWEYFRDNEPDEAMIRVLHQTAEYLAGVRELRVVTFAQLKLLHSEKGGCL
jgi:hypothetical protein